MRTRVRGAAAVLVVAAASACADQTPPTAPRRSVEPAAAVATPTVTSTSTICVGYVHRRAVAQLRLEAAQERHAAAAVIQKLSDEIDHMDRISRDACN